jgi:hypothetical protein
MAEAFARGGGGCLGGECGVAGIDDRDTMFAMGTPR